MYNRSTPRQNWGGNDMRSRMEMPEHMENDRCRCIPNMECPSPCQAMPKRRFGVYDSVLATVYVPVQKFQGLYDMDTALSRGTLFCELDKPFCGGKECGCRG